MKGGAETVNCRLCGSGNIEPVIRKWQIVDMQIKPTREENAAFGILDLMICLDCSAVFVASNLLNRKRNLFGDLYNESLSTITEDEITTMDHSIGVLQGFIPKGEVLEIGSAQGTFLNALKQAGYSVQGCEPGNAYYASRERYPDIEVTHNVFDKEDYKGTGFDIVILQHCLEHIPNPKAVIKAIRGILRNNGILFVQVPNFEFSIDHNVYSDICFEHVLYFNRATLPVFLENNGFKVLVKESQNDGRDQLAVAQKANTASAGSFTEKARFFASEYQGNRRVLNELILDINRTGKKVVVYGAGGTLLSLSSLGEMGARFLGGIEHLVDGNERRQGNFLPLIPKVIEAPSIIAELNNPEDYVFLICSEKYRYEIHESIASMIGEKVQIFSMYPLD